MLLHISFGRVGSQLRIADNASLSQLGYALASATGASFETIKVFIVGVKGLLQPARNPGTSLQDAGVADGAHLRVIGSLASEVEAVRSAKDVPGVIGFEQELLRYARRRNIGATVAPKPPSGPYTFGSYKALSIPQAQPGQAEALKLLHRLAADVGIVHIMQQNRFEVGLLSEMPPTDSMDEQRQITCLLGLNINRGQEIKLRLRTNDLKGFRKYETIRETLVHELTHNVWSGHDNNFKTLNSQLLRECIQRSRGGIALASSEVYEGQQGDYLDQLLHREEAATSSGRTLLGHGDSAAAVALPRSATQAAGDAALARLSTAAQSVVPPPSSAPQAVQDIARAYEHADPSTEAEEAVMSALGRDQHPDDTASTSSGAMNAPPWLGTMQHSSLVHAAQLSHQNLALPMNPQSPAQEGSRSGCEQSPRDRQLAATDVATQVVSPEEVDSELIDGMEATPVVDFATDAAGPIIVGTDHLTRRGAQPPAVDVAMADVQHQICHGEHGEVASHSDRSADQQPSRSLGDVHAQVDMLGISASDPMVERLAHVYQAVSELESSAGRERALTALTTVQKILSNSLHNPGVERYASVRRSNAVFSRCVAAWSPAERLLQLAGFALCDGERWTLGKRQDPGILWLVLDAIQNRVACSRKMANTTSSNSNDNLSGSRAQKSC